MQPRLPRQAGEAPQRRASLPGPLLGPGPRPRGLAPQQDRVSGSWGPTLLTRRPENKGARRASEGGARPPREVITVMEQDLRRYGGDLEKLAQCQVPAYVEVEHPPEEISYKDAFDQRCRLPGELIDPWRDIPNPEKTRNFSELDLILNEVCPQSPKKLEHDPEAVVKTKSKELPGRDQRSRHGGSARGLASNLALLQDPGRGPGAPTVPRRRLSRGDGSGTHSAPRSKENSPRGREGRRLVHAHTIAVPGDGASSRGDSREQQPQRINRSLTEGADQLDRTEPQPQGISGWVLPPLQRTRSLMLGGAPQVD